MGYFYGVCIALPAILVAVVYYHVRSRGAAFVFTVIVRLILSRYLKKFSVSRISLFPLAVDGVQVTTKGSRQLPEITITWRSLKVNIDLRRFWRNYSFNWNVFEAAAAAAVAVIMEENNTKKFICITVEELVVSSPNLQFKNVLNPSSSVSSFPTASSDESKGRMEYWWESIKRRCLAVPALFSKLLRTACLQSLLDLFLIRLENLKVSLELPTHLSSIEISALQCLIYAGGSSGCSENLPICTDPYIRSTSPDGLGVLLAMDMKEGKLLIKQNNETAFDYSGTFYRFSVDVHIPSRHMTFSFCSKKNLNNNHNNSINENNLERKVNQVGTPVAVPILNRERDICTDIVSVRVQSLLEFYNRFQSAEDDAIELKLAKGLGSSGKIRCMSLSIEALRVGITDFRNPKQKILSMNNLFFGIRTFRLDGISEARLGGGGWLGGMGIFSDLFDTLDSNNEVKRVSLNIDKETTISASRVEWLLDRELIPHSITSPSSSSSSLPGGIGCDKDEVKGDDTFESTKPYTWNSKSNIPIRRNSIKVDSEISSIRGSNSRDKYSNKNVERDKYDKIDKERIGSNDGYSNNNHKMKEITEPEQNDEIAVFEMLSATKSIRVANSGDYIDKEILLGSARNIQLECLSADTLDWQLIAQAISNSLPISRFSHVKHSDYWPY